MLKNILIALAIVALTLGATDLLDEDFGLKQACEQKGGQFKPRESKDAIVGDRCALVYNVATRSQSDAEEFCELYAPWRLEKAVRKEDADRNYVECHVEATMTCQPGWTQMFGYCFKMPDKLAVYTRSEGVQTCKNAHPDGEIAFIHHRYIVGIWRRYFRGVGQIWVDATDTFDKYIVDTGTVEGDALALAFTGRHFEFNVPANSLIRIKSSLKMQLICQYKPPMTAAEINYLGRRYSEIYYPSIPVDHGILVRSASSYNSKTSALAVCEKVLKPFLTDTVGPFVPDQETLAAMKDINLPFVHMTRSGAQARVDISLLVKDTCQPVSNRFEVVTKEKDVANFEIKNVTNISISCDHMKSAAITHFGGEVKLSVMSDSRRLPIWCKLGRQPKFFFSEPGEGFKIFLRENSLPMAHRLFTEQVTYDEAQKKCQSVGGYVSGINSLEEIEFMGRLAEDAKQPDIQYWLGGKRKLECYKVQGYTEGETDPCARNKVIEWENGVAESFQTDWWRDGNDHTNPSSYPHQVQGCLTYVHGKPGWAKNIMTSFLDDVECDAKKGFFCSKKVEVLKEEY